MTIRIERYTETHRDAVRDLIIPIQREEFGIDITYEDQPDLAEIPSFYQRDAGEFWIALDGDALVGTIALIDIGDGLGALRKMFVAESHRGGAPGVARLLLDILLDHAAREGLSEVYLGTTEAFRAAHRFYEKSGFDRVDPDDLPGSFPRMAPDTRFYVRRFAEA